MAHHDYTPEELEYEARQACEQYPLTRYHGRTPRGTVRGKLLEWYVRVGGRSCSLIAVCKYSDGEIREIQIAL